MRFDDRRDAAIQLAASFRGPVTREGRIRIAVDNGIAILDAARAKSDAATR